MTPNAFKLFELFHKCSVLRKMIRMISLEKDGVYFRSTDKPQNDRSFVQVENYRQRQRKRRSRRQTKEEREKKISTFFISSLSSTFICLFVWWPTFSSREIYLRFT